jgi:hypothetical protein
MACPPLTFYRCSNLVPVSHYMNNTSSSNANANQLAHIIHLPGFGFQPRQLQRASLERRGSL